MFGLQVEDDKKLNFLRYAEERIDLSVENWWFDVAKKLAIVFFYGFSMSDKVDQKLDEYSTVILIDFDFLEIVDVGYPTE